MKLEHIIEARYAHSWKPKTLTQQWIELVDPEQVKDKWTKRRKQDYQHWIHWIMRHEDELNVVYEYLDGGWSDFVKDTEPPRKQFDQEREEWDYEWAWDTTEFKPYDTFDHTKAYKQLVAADDFDEDYFQDALDQMSYVVMQGV